MNCITFLLDRFAQFDSKEALSWGGKIIKYSEVLEGVVSMQKELIQKGISAGDVVVLEADYSDKSIPLLLALFSLNVIVVPLLPLTISKNPNLLDLVKHNFHISALPGGDVIISDPLGKQEQHALINELRAREVPGLVLFTSGSSGNPKAVVHDFSKLLEKFKVQRSAFRTINFLLFDHWGGLNTLFYSLSNGSFLVLPESRSPDYVCTQVEKHKLELLPSAPSFLNMLLVSGAIKRHNLSSLKLITYGAEPMPEVTLERLNEELPDVEARQTYGLIELGVLRAKSKSKDSLWVKVGGEGYDVRIADGLLEVKADAAMLGYLNAPSPFTDDGYFKTGDRVLQDGDYIKILGRDSDLINVGGQKVFPQEVENVLLEEKIVKDAVVYGASHPLSGSIVCAKILLESDEDPSYARSVIKKHCSKKLELFKVPVKIQFVKDGLHSDRMKRLRRDL